MAVEVFNRCEKKYLLNEEQYRRVVEEIGAHMDYDVYNADGEVYKICNIYYDTENDELIRMSIDKPVYKEKLRVRSYGKPELDSSVFVEIKKKYNGIVNKRRTAMRLKDAYGYLDGILLEEDIIEHNTDVNRQVLDEIDYFKKIYKLVPKLYLSYDRIAYAGRKDKALRVTFDTNITTRRYNVRLEEESYGEQLLPPDVHLMEIKTDGAIPMWLVKIISKFNIYPTSFSKYGTEYMTRLAALSDSKGMADAQEMVQESINTAAKRALKEAADKALQGIA